MSRSQHMKASIDTVATYAATPTDGTRLMDLPPRAIRN